MELTDLVEYLDAYLDTGAVPDYSGAMNGLQVANSGKATRLAMAVDATQATIQGAIESGADVLVVHHGLFWDGVRALTGRHYRRVRALLGADLAVYSCHLPLDVHPEIGNNVLLARALGLEVEGRFGEYKGQPVGYWGRLEIRREALAARLDQILGGRVKLIAGGPELVERVGIITGGAGAEVRSAIEAGLDAFVTGEGAHHNYFDAEEGGINLYLGGHYATEVWGVRALGEHLEQRFGLPWTFIDRPTGL